MYLKKEMEFGKEKLSIETGKLAKQAAGSVVISQGDTVLLVTVTSGKDPKLGDFMPLTVDFISKMYSVGKIPGGYLKRESRPPESDILIARLTDRPLRPLFPEGYTYETQVTITVLSVGEENVYESLAITGASAALMLSKIPFMGPIAGAKVGYINGEYILNPTLAEFEESEIDISVAASPDAIVMVEGEAKEVSEEIIVGALNFAHKALKPACQLQIDMMNELNVQKMEEFIVPEYNEDIIKEVESYVEKSLVSATLIKDKMERYDTYDKIKKEAKEHFAELYPEDDFSDEVGIGVDNVKRKLIRGRIANDNLRIDGRNLTTVRPISCETGFLPRVHGTSLFTRGETQALVAVTLGSVRDAKREETIDGEFYHKFMLHYNFPPFSVGEARPLRGPGRREIGHGNLALRGVKFVLPSEEEFPYTIRIVSEILESNGSSSMATVCGSSMALMDAGVPIKKPVAGIAMGLIKEGEGYHILTDILGDEDHLGDMDFKVVGTADGITALQMDIKIEGLPEEVMSKALNQAKEGRLHILGEMAKEITEVKSEMSSFAPRTVQIPIPSKKVGILIGPGGKNIRAITDETGVEVNIDDEAGFVTVYSADQEAMDRARYLIEMSIIDVELDKTYEGTVKELKDFGALVEVLPNKVGLLHISEVAHEHVKDINEFMKVGDVIKVKVKRIDERGGKISLSMKALIPRADGTYDHEHPEKKKEYKKKDYKKDYKKRDYKKRD